MEGRLNYLAFLFFLFLAIIFIFYNTKLTFSASPAIDPVKRSEENFGTPIPKEAQDDPHGTGVVTVSEADNCSDVFDKTGMWLAQTLAKSMTGYFSLINKQLNNNTDIDSTSLKDVFEKVRSVAISLLTLALIIIAFANILQVDLDKYGINRIIPKLIIAIVLSYFSFLIARVMLESANALQALLLNKMAADGKSIDSLSVGTQLTTKLNEGCSALDGLGGLLLMIIVIIITVVAFLWILLLLLARKAVIFALVAVAPLAFIFNALPFTEFLYKQWWTRFIKWVYMGPAIMFFLYLGVEFMDSAAQGQDITIMVLLSGIAVYIAAMMPLVLGKEVFSGIQKAAGLTKMPRKALDAAKKAPLIGQKARELSKRLDLREASKDQRANIEAQRWQAEKAQGGKFSRWMAGTSPEQASALREKYLEDLIKDQNMAELQTGELTTIAVSGGDKAAAALRVLKDKKLLEGELMKLLEENPEGFSKVADIIDNDKSLQASLFADNKGAYAALALGGRQAQTGLKLSQAAKPYELTPSMIKLLSQTAEGRQSLIQKFDSKAALDRFSQEAGDSLKKALADAMSENPEIDIHIRTIRGETTTQESPKLHIPESTAAAQREIEELRDKK